MPFYQWKNKKTGEEVEVRRPMSESSVPPDGDASLWQRVYSVGVGRVEGGGGSPGRVAKVRKT